jgi:GrpB-like predicted nucleotidyltransferase (UPF0157 family)
MTTVDLKPVSEILPQAERIVSRVFAQLAALLPDAELHHIGATALPGGVTKGDVDVLVRVSAALFPAAVAALRRDFAVRQPDNWTAEFASFGNDTGHELPLGLQVVVKDSEGDFLLFLRDHLLANPEVLAEYNRLKRAHAGEGAEGYWQAKDAFFSRVLAARAVSRPAQGQAKGTG